MVNPTLGQAVTQPQIPVEDEVLVEEKGVGRFVTLNRPRVLNCLNLDMLHTMVERYQQWEKDDNAHFIVLKGAGRVFCAGGDLRMFYTKGKSDESWTETVYEKYWFDYHIAMYKKPIIALWHGLVMGGGAGLSVTDRFRVATEKTVFSMPEAAIGFHTDCGSSYWLSHLPGHLGEFVATTGHRLDGAEMLACGLATHYVPLQRLPELESRLSELATGDEASIKAVLDEFAIAVSPAETSILHRQAVIDEIFCKDSMEEIVTALEAHSKESSDSWVKETIKIFKRSSPTGLKVTLKSIRTGRNETLAECLIREYRLTIQALRCTIADDFYEGIRAVVVEKDNAPKWNPATIHDVEDDKLDLIFKPFEESDELKLPTTEKQPRWSGRFTQKV